MWLEILQITDGKPKVAANIKRVSKSSRSLSEGRLGSDMVEEIDRINFGQGRNIAMPTMAIHPFARNEGLIIQDVCVCVCSSISNKWSIIHAKISMLGSYSYKMCQLNIQFNYLYESLNHFCVLET